MLLSSGHSVHLYGVGYCEIKHPNLTFHQLCTLKDIRDSYGDGFDNELGYDYSKGFKEDFNTAKSKLTLKYRDNFLKEIGDKKGLLLLAMGGNKSWLKTNMVTIEPGIGYLGSHSTYRAFESFALQNVTYGKEIGTNKVNMYDRVIPNYFDLDDYEFNDSPKDYFLYMGRLVYLKGCGIAVKIAKHYNKPLYIAGQGDPSEYLKYDKAKYFGVVHGQKKKDLLKNASITLVPSYHIEPFGGVAVESMLSGTPVISTNWGAFPETVKEGVSGYRGWNTDEMIKKTILALSLDRRKVREWALRYSMENVNKLYEEWWKVISLHEKKLWMLNRL
ncbi:MAG: glycosyltransferase family 4 protein [bacterium]|nr:glycosyltransferase family 4 protein [bacterium]